MVGTCDDSDEGATTCHKGMEMPATRKATWTKENTQFCIRKICNI